MSQKGSYLDKNNSFGASIALSASGNIYAASMPDYDPPGLSNAGRILVIGQQLSVSASGTVISDASGTNFTPGTMLTSLPLVWQVLLMQTAIMLKIFLKYLRLP